MNFDATETFVLKKKRSFFDMTGKEKVVFLTQVAGVFLLIVIALFMLGLMPQQWSGIGQDTVLSPDVTASRDSEIINNDANTIALQGQTRPTRVYIPSVGIDTVVTQPQTANVDVLDQFLQQGAVHYPGSGVVESGNMFIFGHSTNWAVVRNEAYKTFNNLEKLNPGDEIFVEADGKQYVYSVEYVELVDEDEALIDLSGTKRRLTISTCNSFGEKQERWVAHANFVREA